MCSKTGDEGSIYLARQGMRACNNCNTSLHLFIIGLHVIIIDLDYRKQLIKLKTRPLMMEYESIDIMFLVKLIKFPSYHFNICDFVEFYSHSTRGSSNFKHKI